MSNGEKGWRVIIRPNPDGIPKLEIKKVSKQKDRKRRQGVEILPKLLFWYPVIWISGILAYLLQSNTAFQIYERAINEAES